MTDTAAQEFHLNIDVEGSQAVALLAEASQLSKGDIKQAMQKGALWLSRGQHTQRLRRASKQLKPGDSLHFYYNRKVLSEVPPVAELVADEGSYSVWNKPYGLRSQGSKWSDHCTLYRWAEQHLEPQRTAFIVHRLDRAACGLMLLAHSKKMAASLSALFQQRQVEKHYTVWVQGDFSVLAPAPWHQITIDEPLDNKPAVSHIRFYEYNQEREHSRLDVAIETGRKHQVRRHLAGTGYPVVGDRLYGDSQPGDQNLQLLASTLAFKCPETGEHKSYTLNT